MSKTSMAIAGGIGFLLGSRAGRAPYEKAMTQVSRLRNDPEVRSAVENAATTARDTAGAAVQTAKTKVDEVTSGPGTATP